MPRSSPARLIRWREAELSEFAAWTRLDRPGRDAALLRPHAGGWLLQGAAAFDHDSGPATVAYQVETDARWETRRGTLSGFLGEKTVRHEILRDNDGWRLNGVPVEGLGHLVDLDFGFTPATNVLQLKRIALSARSEGRRSGRVVRSRQRLADRIAADLRTARGRVLLVRGADGSLSGSPGNRPERVCPVLSGSLAACRVKRLTPAPPAAR